MRRLTLYKDDIARDSVLTWNGILEDLGVETHVLVGGRYIDKEIESIDLHVSETIVDSETIVNV